jgi:hypothetical protein
MPGRRALTRGYYSVLVRTGTEVGYRSFEGKRFGLESQRTVDSAHFDLGALSWN